MQLQLSRNFRETHLFSTVRYFVWLLLYYTGITGIVSCNRDCMIHGAQMTSCHINKVCRPHIYCASTGHNVLREGTVPQRDKSTPGETKLS